MRLVSLIKYDIRFQFRHGFYYAYFVISLLYIALLYLIPQYIRATAAVLIIFSDPSVLGFFFIGGIVLLERSQSLYEPLFVTPLRVYEFLASKIISLAFLSCLAVSIVVLPVFGFPYRYIYLYTGVLLTSALFTLAGLIVAVQSKSLNGYLVRSPILGIFVLPVLGYLEIWDHPILYILPTRASLILLDAAFQPRSPLSLIYAVSILAFWIAGIFFLTYKVFSDILIYRRGGEGK